MRAGPAGEEGCVLGAQKLYALAVRLSYATNNLPTCWKESGDDDFIDRPHDSVAHPLTHGHNCEHVMIQLQFGTCHAQACVLHHSAKNLIDVGFSMRRESHMRAKIIS